jgi:guanylate kinase
VSDDTEHRGRIFVLAAPSGGGKTSLIRALIERNRRLGPSVSHTTRPARPGERHGEHYYFVDEPEFRSLIDEDAFLEYALVFGDYKGTSKREVENRTAAGCDVLLDIDWQGARQVRESMPDSRSIFILPPSLETLKERLARQIGHGADPLVDEENDKPTVIALREIADGMIDSERIAVIQAEIEARQVFDQDDEEEDITL